MSPGTGSGYPATWTVPAEVLSSIGVFLHFLKIIYPFLVQRGRLHCNRILYRDIHTTTIPGSVCVCVFIR